jgi:L-ascorbate metabolism protein UlaG (beta-lactamase superfamily)
MLWGAFVIQYQNLTIYFGGDSGYDEHFKEAASLYPKIDYAILSIGAYEPRWFMQQSHTTPKKQRWLSTI